MMILPIIRPKYVRASKPCENNIRISRFLR